MVAGATSGLPEHELASCWDKGARKVAGQARAYPALADVGFSPPGVFAPPGYAPAPAAGGAPVRMRDRAVRWSQLATMPEPEPLIEGYLFRDSLAWLSGEPGCGKSFIGIDFALCVATGLPWHGRPVKRGKVLYVMAEGSRGAWPRCAAWSRQHNGGAPVDDDAFAIYPDAVQAGDAVSWAELVEWVGEDAFDLIVLDTQARVTVGMEENSNTDMGVFVHRVEQLRAATGGTVLIVHHLPKGGDSLRGASALEGAAYTVLRAEKTGTVITVHQTKQKDSAELAPFLLRMEVVPLVAGDPAADGYGLPGVPAPALVDYDQAAAAERAAALSVDLSDGQARIVAVFVEVFYEGHGATKAEARVQFMRRGGSDAGFYRAWNWAIETARLARIQGRDSYRWVTNEG
jgi:KaiC/GvpD/RAD55 family RecA-like ATPase